MSTTIHSPDAELKARHRKMWASGDYSSMVETWLLPLGPRLADACRIGPGTRVLDVAAGTGNASIPAARAGAPVTASDLTAELLEAGRRRAEAAGVEATTTTRPALRDSSTAPSSAALSASRSRSSTPAIFAT
jgi:2-polyprenyl-3-methyl-5-hydroxy-6-metoxy-1,4-benzoquinol methylase